MSFLRRGSKTRIPLMLKTSTAEPAMVFDSPTRQAAIQELPIAPNIKRSRVQPAARFATMRRIMSRAVLNRGKS